MSNIESNLLFLAEQKLEALMQDNNLTYSFNTDSYPITLSVSQDLDPSAQMEIYDTSAGDVSDRDSKLTFIFRDGELIVRSDSRLVISDDLLGKIKGLAKKMHYLFLQSYFRDTCGVEAADDEE